MRIPALTQVQREARDYIHHRRGIAAELVQSCQAQLTDIKYEARVHVDKLLSAGDTQQIETVLAQAEKLLAACAEALPALQAFEDRFAMPAQFERLKQELIADHENPDRLEFADNYEAMTWLADRVLLFSKHVNETLLPWLKNALGEINEWMVDRAKNEDHAPKAVAEARTRLAELAAANPGLRFLHSEGILAEAERFLAEMSRASAESFHKGVAENAAAAIEYAEGAITMAEEALQFRAEPRTMALGAKDAILAARADWTRSGRSVPPELDQAAQLVDQALAAASRPDPDWTEACLLYNRASALFAGLAEN